MSVALVLGFRFIWFGPVYVKSKSLYLHNKKLKEELLHRVSALQDLVALQENLLLALGNVKNQHAYLSTDYIYFTEK